MTQNIIAGSLFVEKKDAIYWPVAPTEDNVLMLLTAIFVISICWFSSLVISIIFLMGSSGTSTLEKVSLSLVEQIKSSLSWWVEHA